MSAGPATAGASGVQGSGGSGAGGAVPAQAVTGSASRGVKAGVGSAPVSSSSVAADVFGVVSPTASAPELASEAEGSAGREGAEAFGGQGAGEEPSAPLSDAEREAAAVAEQPEGQQVAEGEGSPEGETPEGGYVFAGQEFESQQAAENEFKRALGRLKAQGKELSDLREYGRQAIESALAWQKHAQLQLSNAGQSSPGPSGLAGPAGGPQGESPASPPPDLSKFADTLDWNAVAQIADEHGTMVAWNYTLRKLTRAAQEAVQQAVEQGTAPFREFHDRVAEAQVVNGLLEQAAQATDSGGTLMYPELGVSDEGNLAHPDAVNRILALHKRIVDDMPVLRGNPQAIHFAVLEYRRLYPETGGGAGVPVNPPRPAPPKGAGVGAQVRRVLEQSAQASAETGGSTPGAPLRPRRGGAPSEDDVIDAAVERMRGRVHPVFAVAR